MLTMATYHSSKWSYGSHKQQYNMISQRIKSYFVDFFFHSQSTSFASMIECDLPNTTSEILVVYVIYK